MLGNYFLVQNINYYQFGFNNVNLHTQKISEENSAIKDKLSLELEPEIYDQLKIVFEYALEA